MHVAFAASECVPFSKTGGLADVVGALPRALAQLGHRVSVYLPYYRQTRTITEPEPLRTLVRSITIPFDDRYRFCSVLDGGLRDGVQFYFIDYPPFFDREALYGPATGDYWDNAQRFALYSRAVIEASKILGVPDLFHCHDWQAALIPVLLRSIYTDDWALAGVPTVFTIHNIGYQGVFHENTVPLLMLPWDLFTMDKLEFFGQVNFLKGALAAAEYVTTVSRRYAYEIQTADYGFGLEGVLRARASTVTGILNGVDYNEWDPARDRHLAAQFSPSDLSGKRECKRDLLAAYGVAVESNDAPATSAASSSTPPAALSPDAQPFNSSISAPAAPQASATTSPPAAPLSLDTPVLGIVSRFASQKGFDLIAQIADRLAREDVIVTVLGSGDREYEELFRRMAQVYPGKYLVKVAYDNALAHKIEAGADMFLMPSRYEPCGLNQIYSLKYGTVPIVRATGGLDDTVEQWNPDTRRGTGFKFADYSSLDLYEAIQHAVHVYRTDTAGWRQLMLNGMARDHSWTASAREYVKVYDRARQIRGG